MNVSYTTIGQNIRRARCAANLSVQETAELMGISLLYYQRFENGERPVSLETLALICRTLHCSVSSLLANAFTI